MSRRQRRQIVRPQPYTGFPGGGGVEYYRPQGGGGGLSMGGSRGINKMSITTGGEEQKEPGFVDQLNNGINTYKTINKAYDGGKNIGKWFGDKFGATPGATPPAQPGSYDFMGPSANTEKMVAPWDKGIINRPEPMPLWNPTTPQGAYPHPNVANTAGVVPPSGVDTPMPSHWNTGGQATNGPAYSGLLNSNAGASTSIPGDYQFGSRAGNTLARNDSLASGSLFDSAAGTRVANLAKGVTGIGSQVAVPGTYSALSGGTDLAGAAITQAGTEALAKTGMEVGGEAAAQAAAQGGTQAAAQGGTQAAAQVGAGAAGGAGSKALGAAGGALGAGLSISDMIDNGVTVQNAAGLISGGAFMAAPWLAAAGPVGWVALGIGAVATIFDW
jgi:hypothetical protein